MRIPLSLLTAGLMLAQVSSARTVVQDDMKARYEEKLSHDFIPFGGWVTDYDQARELARKEDKVLFTYFSRSYAPWGPCNALESGALSDKDFPGFAGKVVPFLHVTTRIPGHPYDDLLTVKGGTGFPTLMFLDAEGRILEVHRGPRTVGGFEKTLESAQAFQDLVKKAEAGDASVAAEVLIRQLQLEWFDLEQAQARATALKKVSSKQKKEIDQLLIDTEVRSLAAEAGKDEAKRIAAGKHFHQMWEDKRVPSSTDQLYPFWFLMADYAESSGDKKLFKKVYEQAEEALKRDSRYGRVLKSLEDRLERFSKR